MKLTRIQILVSLDHPNPFIYDSSVIISKGNIFSKYEETVHSWMNVKIDFVQIHIF